MSTMSTPATPFSASTSHRTLLWALGVSVLVHAGLLTLKWVSPTTFDRIFETNTLEVVLVNSRSTNAPDAPLALAQVNLAGGGQVSGITMQSSPFSANQLDQNGQELQQVEKKIETLKSEQIRLIQQLKQELSQLSSQTPASASDGKADALNERKHQLSSQLAQIEKQSQALQGGPKKRYIGPATQEVSFARYYDKMRRTIELTGTENFPQAGGEKLYGSLTMVITLDAKGRVLETEIATASGKPMLDKRAQAIVRGASPFDNFTPEMKRQADQLVVVSRFHFARDETLETRMLAPQTDATSARSTPAQRAP
jgi:protein TonB